MFHKSQLKYHTQPLIGYLNINSPRNKIFLRYVTIKPDFVVSDNKLVDNFFLLQSVACDGEIRNYRDINKFGGGLIEYIWRGFTCNTVKEFDTKSSETICSEI